MRAPQSLHVLGEKTGRVKRDETQACLQESQLNQTFNPCTGSSYTPLTEQKAMTNRPCFGFVLELDSVVLIFRS